MGDMAKDVAIARHGDIVGDMAKDVAIARHGT